MDWLNIDFVKCDEIKNKSLVINFEPHWSTAVSQEAYDVKLPFCPNVNEIIFSKEGTNDQLITYNSQQFYFPKHVFIKQIYLDLETLFTADNIVFDFPFNEDIIMNYQTDVILASPIKHKEFRVNFVPLITAALFQSYIITIVHLYKHNNDSWFNDIKLFPHSSLAQEIEEVVKLQAEILSNFSEEEIKAMDMETSPLYLPIVAECACNYFNVFMSLIYLANNKETLSHLLTSERELSGEAKAIIIKRMDELDDERSFEL